jgi:hypothetical protein
MDNRISAGNGYPETFTDMLQPQRVLPTYDIGSRDGWSRRSKIQFNVPPPLVGPWLFATIFWKHHINYDHLIWTAEFFPVIFKCLKSSAGGSTGVWPHTIARAADERRDHRRRSEQQNASD